MWLYPLNMSIFPGAYPNTSLASLSDRHITKGHENDFKLVCYLYVTCILQWGNKTEKVMPTLLGIKLKKSRVSKTYFNVMQFIFVNYFFIWVLPSEVTCCCPTCCAGPETQHEFNIVHCRVTQYELVLKLWPHKERNINSMHYHEEWMFALVNKCVLITE